MCEWHPGLGTAGKSSLASVTPPVPVVSSSTPELRTEPVAPLIPDKQSIHMPTQIFFLKSLSCL